MPTGDSEFQLDDQKLANEIKNKARRSKVFTNFSYIILPLAACFVALISWQIKDKPWSMNEKVAHSMDNTQELDFASDLSSEDLELLDDWLLAAPDFVDFSQLTMIRVTNCSYLSKRFHCHENY
jgi:hypothetical protein